MENYKYYFKKIVKSLANDYKLSKSTERFLNLLMIECARKIIEKANQLLHPVDYETQKIQKFESKVITARDVKYSTLLLFPQEIGQHYVKEADRITELYQIENPNKKVNPKKINLNIPFALGQILIQNFASRKISFDEGGAIYLSSILEIFITEILEFSIQNSSETTLTRTSIQNGIKADKDLSRIIKILNVSV